MLMILIERDAIDDLIGRRVDFDADAECAQMRKQGLLIGIGCSS